MENMIERLHGESEEEFLVRLGSLKENKTIYVNWEQIADIMNDNCNTTFSESYWRKKYKTLINEMSIVESAVLDGKDEGLKKFFREVEKQRVRTRDERNAYSREVRSQARVDTILELFKEEISKYNKKEIKEKEFGLEINESNKSIYVMLSDIHYGLDFDTIAGSFNSDIARERVLKYAQSIIDIGKKCKDCYVSLMGDMVSGIIHQTIRVENKENVIEQIVGVSELVSDFLYILSSNFEHVYVNSVDGNHSRLDPNLENVLRGEKLDSLIPWYCKAKLENQNNVIFIDNKIDSTIGNFTIFDKTYVCVHGDYEKDLKHSANNIEKMIGQHIDYMLAGHMHVADMRCEDTVYIRNGSVCGSGDDYTIKKRLFGPAVQVCMICTEQGVESIHPVIL